MTPATLKLDGAPPSPTSTPPAQLQRSWTPSTPPPWERPPPGLVTRAWGVDLHLNVHSGTGYEGVSASTTTTGLFIAQCRFKGTDRYLGSFESAVEAAVCYAKIVRAQMAEEARHRIDVAEKDRKAVQLAERSTPLRLPASGRRTIGELHSEPRPSSCKSSLRSVASPALMVTPLLPHERDAIEMRHRRWEAERALEAREAKVSNDAQRAVVAIKEQQRKGRTDEMARAHRERQALLQYVSLRERRPQQERKFQDAGERREAYLSRFVSPRKSFSAAS